MRILLLLLLVLVPVLSIGAQADVVECVDGAPIENGVEVVLIVPGGSYTITALGINGFDPVLATRADSGPSACEDDTEAANEYAADLPTTGEIEPSDLNAQVSLTGVGDDLNEIPVVVGGLNGSEGEFLLLVEGLAIDDPDDADLFDLLVSSNTVEARPYTLYVIGQDELDPWLSLVDAQGDPIADDEGIALICDDAGSNNCWGESERLEGSTITTSETTLEADNFDSMLTVPWENISVEEVLDNYMRYAVTSFNGSTSGSYVLAIHMGIGEPAEAVRQSQDDVEVADEVEVACTDTAQALEGESGTTYLVTCPADCTAGIAWGTDKYTDDSYVCTAALHAGVITSDGGSFLLRIEPGQTSYASTTRNGVTTSEWGEWNRSFTVSEAPGN